MLPKYAYLLNSASTCTGHLRERSCWNPPVTCPISCCGWSWWGWQRYLQRVGTEGGAGNGGWYRWVEEGGACACLCSFALCMLLLTSCRVRDDMNQ